MIGRFLTTDEVAEQLHTNVNTLRYWRSAGTGPESIKIGRRVLYPVEALEAFIAASAGSVPTGEPAAVQALRAENKALRTVLRRIRDEIDGSGLL